MADSIWIPTRAEALPVARSIARHSVLVRITHWIITIAFFALLITGIEILISHPRFYWGETGNVNMTPLFKFNIPSSRATVPTGYGYVLPDQNGWSRYLHFQSAWVVVLTGLLYFLYGLVTRHFLRNLLPSGAGTAYNTLQRITYLFVIFGLFPLVIWTGLAMSPSVTSVFPPMVTLLGGQQSARTIHFFVSVFLVIFLAGHVSMVIRSGFRDRMRGMITGSVNHE
jgi:thiosulfate reductase cytochrome b subunit